MMETWDLNLRHLRAVAKIARLGTVNAAALAVSLSQPAITQALARLESALGVPLFDRRHDGMVPTEAGNVLVPRIEAALAHVRSPHVTMARLRALLALADAGSYAGAGYSTGLSLPSIHRAVNDLALALRRPLAARRGKVVIVTEAGASLAREFRLAKVELEAGLSEVAALRGEETRRIAIGAMPLSRARVLPVAVARFLKRRPKVKLTIVEGSRAELVEPLRCGTLDLMVGALRDPLVEPDLEQRVLFEDMPAFYARRGHPLAGTGPMPADLAAYPFALPPHGAPLRDSFERYFAHAGIAPPEVPVESGSVMMVRQILIASDYVTLLSPDQVAVEVEAGWLVKIGRLPRAFRRRIGVTVRAAARPTEVQAEFLRDLAEAGREIGQN